MDEKVIKFHTMNNKELQNYVKKSKQQDFANDEFLAMQAQYVTKDVGRLTNMLRQRYPKADVAALTTKAGINIIKRYMVVNLFNNITAYDQWFEWIDVSSPEMHKLFLLKNIDGGILSDIVS